MKLRKLLTVLAPVALCTAASLCAGPQHPAADIPEKAGTGLDAQFWAQPAKTLRSLGRQGLEIMRDTPVQATFSATILNYAGNDLLTLEDWLDDDVSSLKWIVKSDPNVMGDCLIRFTGYIAIPVAGEVTFRSESDDGSIVWIGGKKIIHNDGYGAAPGNFPEGTVHIEKPGLYPIEIAFFNGDWTSETGTHGESIIRIFVDGERVAAGSLYSRAAHESSLGFPANPLTKPSATTAE